VLLTGIDLSTAGYSRVDALNYLDRVVAAVRPLPGVTHVTLAEDVPLGFDGGSWEDLAIDGYMPQASENMKIYRNLVAPGYFDLMGIRLVDGRDFTDRDTREAPFVAVVNETFARRYFNGGSVVGRRFTSFGRPVTIVGVAADSKYHALSEPAEPYFYVPIRQLFNASTGVALHVRTSADPLAIAPAVVDAIRSLDPAIPPDTATTLAAYTSAAYYAQKLAASLLTVLGALALLLSAIGLYSLMAYGVARRRRELGVRIALGASGGSILGLVMGRGLSLVAAGVVVGLVLALASTRALSSLLYGVSPLDGAAFAASATVLIAIACLASYLPARAASRVDPMVALRSE
jgi:predicted permease